MTQSSDGQVQLLRLRLSPARAEEFFLWAAAIKERAEVQEALRAEGILVETIFRDGSDAYLYQLARDLAQANAAFQRSQNPVDREAADMIARCVESASVLPAVFHLARLQD